MVPPGIDPVVPVMPWAGPASTIIGPDPPLSVKSDEGKLVDFAGYTSKGQ